MRSMMSLLTALANRMDHYKRSSDGRQDSASVHALYAVAPEHSNSRATVEDGSARHPGAANGYLEVSKEVRACVVRCL